jgi:protein associated with RNAse G/E
VTQWRIEVRKWDQRLHYAMFATLVEDDGERLWFAAQVGTVIEHFTYGSIWSTIAPFDLVLWRDRWYNVYINADVSGVLEHYYCNVALPPIIEGHTLSFVDIDLDVRFWLDGRHEVLDEDEFIAHTALFGYPDDVQRRARQTVQELLALWQARQPPFDGVLPPGSAITL